MPPQTTTAAPDLMKKLGPDVQKTFDQLKQSDDVLGAASLPIGIKGGVFQLTKCYFKEKAEGDDKGKLFFFASGVVVHPVIFTDAKGNSVKVEGSITRQMENCYDEPEKAKKAAENGYSTRATRDEHLAQVMKILRTCGANLKNLANINMLNGICANLEKSKPFIGFETTALPQSAEDKKNGVAPRCYESWTGVLPAFKPPANPQMNGVMDSTGTTSRTPTSPPIVTPKASPSHAPPSEPPDDSVYTDQGDIDSLADLADAGDDAAATTLIEMATRAGLDKATIDNAPTYANLVSLMKTDDSSPDEESGDPGEEPEVGSMYGYRPINAKNRKPADKAVEVEVVKVDAAAKTCDLKNAANMKIVYKGVAWDSLEETPTA